MTSLGEWAGDAGGGTSEDTERKHRVSGTHLWRPQRDTHDLGTVTVMSGHRKKRARGIHPLEGADTGLVRTWEKCMQGEHLLERATMGL